MENPTNLLIVLIPVVVSIISVIFITAYVLKTSRGKFNKNAEKLGGSASGFNKIEGTAGNIDYKIKYTPKHKNNPAQCRIFVGGKSPFFSMSFIRESSFHKLVKYLKLSSELQTNDKRFDDAVYIDCRNNMFAKTVLTSTDVKNDIIRLFQNIKELEKIKFSKDGVEMVLSPFELNSMEKSFLEENLPVLEKILNRISTVPKIGTETSYIFEALWYFFFGLYIIGGVVLFTISHSKYEPVFSTAYFSGFLYGLAAFAGMICFLYFSVRGKSNSHIIFLICLSVGIAGIFFTGVGSTLFYNGYFDKSEGIKREIVITNKYKTRSKNSTNYHLIFYHWNFKNKTISVSVSSTFYHKTNINDRLPLITRPGALGFEWMEDIER
ncbi:MAG TPA: hypothetical protein PKY81_04500 [bacterium]|nr:hypothetical protein [bacterium]HPN30196.1 hypothetical protein [bacterium]